MTEIKGPDGSAGRLQEMPELTRADAAGGETAHPAKAGSAPAQLPADRFEKHQAALLDNLTGRAELAQTPAARQADESPRMIIRDHLQFGQQGLAQNIWGERPGSPNEAAMAGGLPVASQNSLPEGMDSEAATGRVVETMPEASMMIGSPAGKVGRLHIQDSILKPITFDHAATPASSQQSLPNGSVIGGVTGTSVLRQEEVLPTWAGVGGRAQMADETRQLVGDELHTRILLDQGGGAAQESFGNLAAPPTGGVRRPRD